MDTPPSPDSRLAPTLLLSMPQLADPNFHRTVILLCEYGAEGAFGLVLNRPTETSAADVVKLEPPANGRGGLQLWIGGPVEPQRGWILLGEEPAESDAVRVCPGVYLSTSADLLRQLLDAKPETQARLLTGYAGWGPGQLDAEIAASSWLTTDVDLDLVFRTEPDRMWEIAIRRLGADPSALQMSHGVH
ncbi:MAG: YqgE/AlgH family protein [Vicinamibacterales bacterium]|jgi:putative transcriptional regulator|nr:hypothetical protein [Acidobacteriota bacterium]MDP6370941.1 YqgE/AlgH family protein [Vicinamibacterales bacterium]MDP6610327.1 YqgE/AlgH family protein [Vicinamibacterales bacterium]HAK56423.1 YqgE/AlgH family protein [Acidobacteriota bacterium]|tara:strand:- start:49 stop:615 length:567 start_codon:yes stop_codon:yes gene_type:complete